jgi:hypothetical protein
MYDAIRKVTPRSDPSVTAGVIALSACQDDQLAADGGTDGLYTTNLLKVWDQGRFKGDYPGLVNAIRSMMPANQTPGYEVLGTGATFLGDQPFAIPGMQSTDAPPQDSGQPVSGSPVSGSPGSTDPTATSSGYAASSQVPGCGLGQHDTAALSAGWKSNKNTTQLKENDMQTIVDNGNWEEVASALSQQSQTTRDLDGFMSKVITANAAAAQAAYSASKNGSDAGDRGGSQFAVYWWGFHIQVSHQDLTSLLNTIDPSGPIATFLRAVIPPSYQFWITAATPFVLASEALLRALDKGKGIYISMSWFAPGVFVPTTV